MSAGPHGRLASGIHRLNGKPLVYRLDHRVDPVDDGCSVSFSSYDVSSLHRTQVLLVGGGPIGLALAVELGWRGISCTLLDQGNGVVEHPRTGLIAVRTMEAFRRWGIAERIRACGFPDDYPLSMVFCTSLNGRLLDREPYPSMLETPTPPETPEKKQRCPQMWMQPILTAAAHEERNATILYGRRCEGLRQDDLGVTAEVVRLEDGGREMFSAEYLVGCDGATSTVRECLGIEMKGRLLSYSVNILIRSPGLVERHAMGPAERYLFVGPEGTWGNLTVVDGDAIWRLTVLGSKEKFDLSTFDSEHWVRRAFGSEDIPFEILSVQAWRRSEMLAERWLDGRIVLAGDSTHTMSPTGGMGMNTGMQEVLDLGWKLEALLEGWGGPRLLPSYEVERRPVAERNIAFSTQNFKAWVDTPDPSCVLDDDEAGERTRALIGQRLRDSTRVEWESLGLQIGHRYDESPIVVPDGTPPGPDDYSIYRPTSRPGARAPHAWLPDGRSTLDLFGRTFVLLVFDDATGASAAMQQAFDEHSVPLEVVRLTDPAVARLYERALVLVRPDGHVAWRGDAVADPAVIAITVTGRVLRTSSSARTARTA